VEFSQYLAAAAEEVEKALGGGGVAILVPPGSARGVVAKRLIREGIVSEDGVLLYEELHRRLGLGRPLKREGDRFYVGEKPLLNYLKGDTTLSFALRQKSVIVVPRDTTEVLLLRDELLRALEEERLWSTGGVEDLVKVVFLPRHFKGGELAEVDYRRALGRAVKEAKGYSPSLQRLAAEEPKLAQEALEVFRALDPSRYFGGGLHPRVLGMTISAVLSALATHVTGQPVPALKDILSEEWAKLIAQIGGGGLKELLASLFKKGDLRQLFASALRALRYVDDQRLEARVDEVAAKWGLTLEGFKALLHLLAGNVAMREELERLKTLGDEEFRQAVEELVEKKWEKVKKELEERIAALEKEVKEARREFRERIRLLNLSPGSVYIGAEEWPYVEEVGDEVRLKRGLLGGGPLVYNSLIDTVAEVLAHAARGGGGVVVVKGGKGVGKSTAAVAAVYHFLRGAVRVGERVYKPIAVEVKGVVDRGLLQNFVEVANGFGYLPVLYFDPSALPAYPEKVGEEYVPEAPVDVVKEVVARLFDVVKPERRRVVALVVLSKDQYKVVEGEVLRRVESSAGGRLWVIDADEVLKEEKANFVKEVVEKYSGCRGDVVKRVADAIASQFADGYAVAAVLAADWLKGRGCRGEEVERAVKEAEGNVHRFALHYLWYGLFRGDNVTSERYAPLLLAVGFYGPHPPKLAEAIVRAFGEKPEDAVIRWFSQPLHGTLYETIRRVTHGAVYQRFKVGSDEICQGSKEGPCRLVEICSNVLKKISQKNSVEEVAVEYAKRVAEKLEAPRPDGERQIDSLIDNFLQAFNGVAEDGRWRIRYETEGSEGVETVEDVVDELDILSALYGVAVLPIWYLELKPLEGWFFIGGRKVGVVAQYLYPILRERGGELAKRAAAVVEGARGRGGYTHVDLWRAIGIAAAGQWDSAADEDLENAVRLATATLNEFATVSPIVLDNVWPLLSEAWHRVAGGGAYEGGERRQRLADELIGLALSTARGDPRILPRIFTIGADRPDLERVAERFEALYSAASNAGKLWLLEALLYALGWDVGGVDVAAVLLGKPRLGRWGALEEAYERIERFVSRLNGVEKAYAVARLYPLLAARYASVGEFGKAVELTEEALKELEELQSAYEKDKESTEERLRPYLELTWVKPDSGEELNNLSQYVYYHVAFVYMAVDKLDKAVEYAEEACVLAKKLGYVYYEVSSCGLPPRLKTVRSGAPLAEEFEEVWQKALQAVGLLGAETIATMLGEYVVALASVGRLNEVEKVLEKWGWALELYPFASALTYGVLSLFDGQYLEKAVGHLPEGARANLPRLADVLHDAVESGLFVKEPKIAVSARETLTVVYGRNVVKALLELASVSNNLLLSALVGLAYCKRGEGWGLKLAKEAAWAGSGAEGVVGRLFGELYKALEGATVGNCVTGEVFGAVYKLYYRHV